MKIKDALNNREHFKHLEKPPVNSQPLTSPPLKGQSLWAYRWAGEQRGYVWDLATVLEIIKGHAHSPTMCRLSFGKGLLGKGQDQFFIENLNGHTSEPFNEKLRKASA